jgi:hypothetical protein
MKQDILVDPHLMKAFNPLVHSLERKTINPYAFQQK